MSRKLVEAVCRVGLELHPGKANILPNAGNSQKPETQYFLIGGHKIEILTIEASTLYLGWSLSLEDGPAISATAMKCGSGNGVISANPKKH